MNRRLHVLKLLCADDHFSLTVLDIQPNAAILSTGKFVGLDQENRLGQRGFHRRTGAGKGCHDNVLALIALAFPTSVSTRLSAWTRYSDVGLRWTRPGVLFRGDQVDEISNASAKIASEHFSRETRMTAFPVTAHKPDNQCLDPWRASHIGENAV